MDSHNAGHCHFLMLPPELRLMIYRLLLSPVKVQVLLTLPRHRNGPLYLNPTHILRPAILRACKLINGEAIKILYSNTFMIDMAESIQMYNDFLGKLYRKIGESNAGKIKKLRLIGYHDTPSQYYFEPSDLFLALRAWAIGLVAKIILQYFPSVRLLEIEPNNWGSDFSMLCGWPLSELCPELLIEALEPFRMSFLESPLVKLVEESESVQDIIVVPTYGKEQLNENEKVLQEYLQGLLAEKERSRRDKKRDEKREKR